MGQTSGLDGPMNPGNFKNITCSAIMLVFSSSLGAQEPHQKPPLTWDVCVRETEKNNPDIISAGEVVEKLKAQYQGNYSGFLPQLSLDAGFSRANSATSIQSLGTGAGVRQEYDTAISARQNLFSGWHDKAGIDKARTELMSAEANLKKARSSASYDLKAAFARLLYAQEQIKLAQTIANRRKENVRLVELRYDAGREHKGSYLKSKAAYRQSNFEVEQAIRESRVAQRELAKVMGRSQFETLEADGNLKTVTPPENMPDFGLLANETPDYQSARYQLISAQAGVRIAKSQFYPEVSASGTFSRRGSSWPPDVNRWSSSIALSFPFFPGARNIFDLKSAQAEERRSGSELKSVHDQIALNLDDAFAAYQDAAGKTEVQNEFLEAAQVRSQIARSQYTTGLISFDDWDLIENDLITNQKALLSSMRDAVLAEAAWEKALGKG